MSDEENKDNQQRDQWNNPVPDPQGDRVDENDTSRSNEDPTENVTQPSENDPRMVDGETATSHAEDPSQAAVMNQPTPAENVGQRTESTYRKPLDEAELAWLNQEEMNDVHARWKAIQSQFVEEPCAAMEQGEALVAETAERIKQWISEQQKALAQQWIDHDDISTEELRVTLLSYRSLLNRMLKE